MTQDLRPPLNSKMKTATDAPDTLVVTIPGEPRLWLLSGEEIQKPDTGWNMGAWLSASEKQLPVSPCGTQVLRGEIVFIMIKHF